MHVVSSHTNANAVSLKELIPQLESLKLLVCHTPFPLELHALPSCVNLVKLDLSRNNIQSFPHLGHLAHLRLIFIHENLLNLKHFSNIFQKEGASSILSNNIVWITFWGNKDSFLARHFAINRTNAIAFDRNLIAEQEKHSSISEMEGFTKNTDITQLLYTKNFLRTYSSQQEYMQDFWSQLRQLRKQHEALYPIIKIQRVFRGWIFREKVKRQFHNQKDNYYTMFNCLKEWQRVIRSRKKLEIVLKQRKRGYLLFLQGKMDRKIINERLKELAKQAKKRVLKRRLILNNEIKFYAILRSNFLLLQDLYSDLQLSQSKAIYVHKDSLQQFISYVVPFVTKFTNQPIEIAHNLCYHLHYLHSPLTCRKKYLQFLILMKINRFSVISYHKPMQNMLKMMKFKKPSAIENKMKAIFGRYHISKQKKQKIQQNDRKLEQIKRQERNQLIRIQGSSFLLKTMTRGVYFYNANRLSNVSGESRLVMFSQRSIKKISAAVSIQRAWKGYIYRKKHQNQLALVSRIQVAATIIQRWFRRFHCYRKEYFKFYMRGKMSEVKGNTINVALSDYMSEIEKQKLNKHSKQLFLQKHSQVKYSPLKNTLFLGWNRKFQNNMIDQYDRIKKSPFGLDFFKRYLHFSEQQAKIRLYSSNKQNISCQFSHLFHFQTQTSIITTGNKKYLQVKCASLEDAIFRMFAISLFSFDFKSRKGMDFYNNSNFSKDCSIISKNKILRQQMVFVSNENIKMIKNIEDNCRNIEDLKLFIVDNKIFIKVEETKKPLKINERFIVYLINYYGKEQIIKNQQIKTSLNNERKLENGGRIEFNRFQFSDKKDTKDEKQKLSVSSNIDLANRLRENKIIVKKRSMKQFKSKKARIIEKLPHFIIDNKQTQSEAKKQQHQFYSANTKSQVRRKQSQSKIMPTVREFTTKQQTKIQRYQSNIQKINSQKKETNNFIQKFVNLGNFLQHQLLSQQRRKIKTEIEESAHDIFQSIRRSQHKYSKDKQQKTFQRYRRAREMQLHHKSLLQKSRLQASQHIQALRSNATDIRSSLRRDRSNIRPKIIFAEQKFPIILKKPDNLSTK